MNRVIWHLRRAALRQDGAGLTDGELLEQYVTRRDEAAFEALVRRHGPMVLGVCRRVLRNGADAEDAFQATFLVFVRKAASIRSRGTVSNWLYGVAHNTALKAKAMNRKRHVKEREAGTVPKHEARAEVWQEVQSLLDAELSKLADKYRVPIVLCDLEGKTIKEAARHLGWPQGTVATRLTRGRAQLAKRLTKHGLTLSGGVVAAVLSQRAASSNVPIELIASTTKAASSVAATGQVAAAGVVSTKVAALTEGMMKAMLLTKLRFVTTLVLALVPIGVGWGVYQTRAAGIHVKEEVIETSVDGSAGSARPGKQERKPIDDDAKAKSVSTRNDMPVTVQPADRTTSKEWSMPPFDEISISGNLKVLVTPGPTQRVTANGDEEMLRGLRPRVEKILKHARLLLDLNIPADRTKGGSDAVEVRITVPGLSGVLAEGCAAVTIRALESESLMLTVSDTAKIEASGACNSLTAIIHDSGQLDSSRLVCGDVSATASGKSSSVFNAKKSLNVLSSGDSRVEYLGTPAQLNKILSDRSSILRR